MDIIPLAPELNPSAQRCLPRFFTGTIIFKGLTARSLYKSFVIKGLKSLNKLDGKNADCLNIKFRGIFSGHEALSSL
jgi:hypothetical protein